MADEKATPTLEETLARVARSSGAATIKMRAALALAYLKDEIPFNKASTLRRIINGDGGRDDD